MDFGPLRALVLDLNMSAHGVDIVVTRPSPDNTPIETRGIWLTPATDGFPGGMDLQRREPKRILGISKLSVATVPRGTMILAPEKSGDADQRWRVDGPSEVFADHVRVVVVADPEADS